MIKANELRIGNWVLYADTPKVWNVYDYTDDEHFFEPIPLTPDILEKAGFDICYPGAYKNQSNDRLMVLWPNLSWPKRPGLGYSIKENDKTIWIEFVHQLQNLFFALHQDELEINLEGAD